MCSSVFLWVCEDSWEEALGRQRVADSSRRGPRHIIYTRGDGVWGPRVDRAFGQAGPAAAPRLGGLALSRAIGLRFLKAHKGGVAKNGDVDAMTRLLGGEVSTEEGEEIKPHESV